MSKWEHCSGLFLFLSGIHYFAVFYYFEYTTMLFCSLKPHSHKDNPWFKEYWEQIFNCTFNDEMTLRYRGTFNECSGNETLDEDAGSN